MKFICKQCGTVIEAEQIPCSCQACGSDKLVEDPEELRKRKEAERRVAAKPLFDLLDGGLVKLKDKDKYVAKTPVTQALWRLVMGENPSAFIGDENPVEHASWSDCRNFLDKLNSREEVKEFGLRFALPTKDEWEEFHANDKVLLSDPKGKGAKSDVFIGNIAWYWENSERTTHRVAEKNPDPFGLYDVYGNVMEWLDSEGPKGMKLCAGGCWCSSAAACTGTECFAPTERRSYIGFRVIAYKVS